MLKAKLIVPGLQVAAAVILILIGYKQSVRHSIEAPNTYDYIPRSEIIVHSINYPAAVIVSLVTRTLPFRLGIEDSAAIAITYVGTIFILWCWIVSLALPAVFARTPQSRAYTIQACVIGLFCGALLAWATAAIIQGPFPIFLIAAGFAWAAAFFSLFVFSLTRVWGQHPRL